MNDSTIQFLLAIFIVVMIAVLIIAGVVALHQFIDDNLRTTYGIPLEIADGCK